MSVEKYVRDIVEGMGLDYLCESYARANVAFDRYKRRANKRVTATDGHRLPACLFVQPAAGTMNVAPRGVVTDAPACLVCFADEMPLDYTGEEAQNVSDRLRAMAEEFVRRVNRSATLKPVTGSVGYRVAFDSMDANLCTVTLSLTLEEAIGRCI